MVGYANRDTERSQLKKSIFIDNNRITYVDGFKSSGITSFIIDFIESIINEYPQNTKCLLINAQNKNSFSHEVAQTIFRSDFDTEIQTYVNEHVGKKSQNFLQAIIKCVPNIGELLSFTIEKKEGFSVEPIFYESIFSEILIDYFKDYLYKSPDHRIILFIDNAQFLTEKDVDFIKNISLIRKANLVLAWTTSEIQDREKITKITNMLFDEQATNLKISFCEPNIKLVIELGLLHSINITREEAIVIIHKQKKSIHNILDHIRLLKNPQNEERSITEKDIIHILSILNISLEVSYLKGIIEQLPNYLPMIKDDFSESLERLIKDGIIKKDKDCFGSEYITLIISNHNLLNIGIADQELYKNIIYTYFSHLEIDNPRLNLLMYNLTKDLRINTCSIYAKKLFLYDLQTQSQVNREYFEKAQLSMTVEEDCLYAAIFYCKEREYVRALEWLYCIKKNKDQGYFLLEATLLSRCKQQNKAIESLESCLEQKINLDLQCLLNAYLITTHIHSNNILKANKIFKEVEPSMRKSKNYGYLVRNAMTVCSNKLKFYEKALESLKYNEDKFGYFTTLCNKASEYCRKGHYKKSLSLLNTAQENLLEFDKQHLYVLYNNLGICYGMVGDYSKAITNLSTAENYSNEPMPRLFSQINKACFKICYDNKKEGLSELISIEEEVNSHPIDRVRQKYYPNRLFAEHVNQTNTIKVYENYCLEYLDRSTPHANVQLINDLNKETSFQKLTLEKRQKYIQPCYLAYWYVDPLKLFSESF